MIGLLAASAFGGDLRVGGAAGFETVGWETEIKPDVYEHVDEGLPPHEVSAGGSLGVEIGVRFREGVYGIASGEGTVMGLRGFPLRGAQRFGLVARF